MRADSVAGAVFPDCELTDHTGKRRKLLDLQGARSMIQALSREDTAEGPAPGRAGWQRSRQIGIGG